MTVLEGSGHENASQPMGSLVARLTNSLIHVLLPLWIPWQSTDPTEAGEMTQQLRAFASLPEDLGSIPSTHVAAHNYQTLQFQGI